jgi:hypothetical protein
VADSLQFLAMNIVNQLFDLADVPVDVRQDVNDQADAFVYDLLKARIAVDWRAVADVLAIELRKWGWGDMHYGTTPQETSVVLALGIYEDACDRAQTSRGVEP